ncbi:MBL fold metallo-hydrolase [Candidatus Leptofilum sp.]|uniref:MBL fold metallo-hydrolase n=1 Tax=Candidatus Leptofilum sp. TaxID=3241576 RepID=UPI003B5A9BF1
MQEIADNVFIETEYDGVNVGAIRTRRGIVAVDVPSYPRQARDWAMRLHALSPRPVQYTILTDYHGDRILNARWLNAPVIAHQATADRLRSYDKRYPQMLLESLSSRNPEFGRELSQSPVENASMSFTKFMQLWKGGVEIQLIAMPGPTGGSIAVYLPKTEVLFAGDCVVTDMPPLLTEADTAAWLQTIHHLQNWTNPIRHIVPGRGKLGGVEALTAVADYIQAMRQRLQTHIADKLPKEEIFSYQPDFLSHYSQPPVPLEWLKKQVKYSLDHVYDEIQLLEDGHATGNTP